MKHPELVALHVVGGWSLMVFEVPSNAIHSMILFFCACVLSAGRRCCREENRYIDAGKVDSC